MADDDGDVVRGEEGRLVSKREGQRNLSWSDLFPEGLRLYLTDADEVEAIARTAREARDVVLSPLLAMELVSDWRNLRQALDEAVDRSIEASNPGIDMDEVRRFRASQSGRDGSPPSP